MACGTDGGTAGRQHGHNAFPPRILFDKAHYNERKDPNRGNGERQNDTDGRESHPRDAIGQIEAPVTVIHLHAYKEQRLRDQPVKDTRDDDQRDSKPVRQREEKCRALVTSRRGHTQRLADRAEMTLLLGDQHARKNTIIQIVSTAEEQLRGVCQ